MRHWAWVVVAIGAMTATPATAQTKLAYAFQPGATHRQQLIQSTRIDVIPPGQKDTYTTNIDQSCQLITTVKNLREDGTAELAQHFSQISMTLQLPPPSGKRFTADTAKPQPSDDKTENDIRESFRKVVGLDWLLTLKPDGAVSKVGLSDGIDRRAGGQSASRSPHRHVQRLRFAEALGAIDSLVPFATIEKGGPMGTDRHDQSADRQADHETPMHLRGNRRGWHGENHRGT